MKPQTSVNLWWRNAMGFARTAGDLKSRKGCRVRYGSPRDVLTNGGTEAMMGTIVDEVWLDEALNSSEPHSKHCEYGPGCWGDYSFCAQLIKWDGKETPDIRLAYYRRRCGEVGWEYASQTTVSSEPSNIKRLLELTLAKTEWFADHSLRGGQSRPVCVTVKS
jgi:hypothetical protein